MIFKQFLYLNLLCLAFAEDIFDFTGYHLIRIIPENDQHLMLLNEWQNEQDFDVWNGVRGVNMHVDVLLSPFAFAKYKIQMIRKDISYEIIDKNIQLKVDAEAESIRNYKSSDNAQESKLVGTYARPAEINRWLDLIVAANPIYASTYIIGQSIEGRDMKVLKLKTANTKRSIWIDCGIHAREWIAISTCVYFINKVTQEYNSGNSVTQSILDHYEIHILPIVNPDGYEYTFTSRFWRKNRNRNGGGSCLGVDVNRNFFYQWMVAGASSNPCSDTYAGTAAGSEPETQAVVKAINAKRGQWDAFITFHSYGQLFLTPWGYTSANNPDYSEHVRVAQITSSTIKSVYNTTFTIGSSGAVLYLSSGSSRDWAYGDAKIKYSYTLELRPSDSSSDAFYGFNLPSSFINPVGEEMYQGLKTLFTTIKSA